MNAKTGAILDRLAREHADCRCSGKVCTARATIDVLFDDGFTALQGCRRHALALGPCAAWSTERGYYVTSPRAYVPHVVPS